MSAIAELATTATANPEVNIATEAKISADQTDQYWRMTVAQYHRMEQAGILDEDDQLELLEGLLIAKMTKNPPHRLSTGLLQDALLAILPKDYHLNLQEPITLLDSEPEPDLAVIHGQRRDYRDRHPDAKAVALVIEVSDATLERDRTFKQRIYARSGIPIYWILNLRDRQLEVYTEPISDRENQEPKYQQSQILAETELVNVTLKDETGDREFGQIAVKDLF